MKLGLNLQKSQISWFILEFLFFFICVWVRGYKTSLKLVVNNNFEDQDLVQSNATITLLLLFIVNAAFKQGIYLYLVSCYFTILLCNLRPIVFNYLILLIIMIILDAYSMLT